VGYDSVGGQSSSEYNRLDPGTRNQGNGDEKIGGAAKDQNGDNDRDT
jgi:hypothetical protein